jgi:hypothetical protein
MGNSWRQKQKIGGSRLIWFNQKFSIPHQWIETSLLTISVSIHINNINSWKECRNNFLSCFQSFGISVGWNFPLLCNSEKNDLMSMTIFRWFLFRSQEYRIDQLPQHWHHWENKLAREVTSTTKKSNNTLQANQFSCITFCCDSEES